MAPSSDPTKKVLPQRLSASWEMQCREYGKRMEVNRLWPISTVTSSASFLDETHCLQCYQPVRVSTSPRKMKNSNRLEALLSHGRTKADC